MMSEFRSYQEDTVTPARPGVARPEKELFRNCKQPRRRVEREGDHVRDRAIWTGCKKCRLYLQIAGGFSAYWTPERASSVVITRLIPLTLLFFSMLIHSSRAWARPPDPPESRVTAGIPRLIGIFESVLPVLLVGDIPNRLAAADAIFTIGESVAVTPEGRSPMTFDSTAIRPWLVDRTRFSSSAAAR